MMRLADPPLLSPAGVHSVTSMLYLETLRRSEITTNPVGRADGRSGLGGAALEEAAAGQRGVCFYVIYGVGYRSPCLAASGHCTVGGGEGRGVKGSRLSVVRKHVLPCVAAV